MKDKDSNASYARLNRKVFLGMIFIIMAAIATVGFLRILVQGRFGNGIVSLLEDIFYLGGEDAQRIYQYVFRNHLKTLLFIAVIVFLLCFIRLFISWFSKYFNEISVGIDQLAEKSEREITLSPELDFMEKKLNQIKTTLEKQKKDVYEAEQRKNDLVVYLAHDIKTPLTSVIGYLSLLDEASDMPNEQKAKYIGITLEKANRLEQLIDEFFEITRFNLQTIILNKAKINLSFMLQQMADEFYPMLTPQGKKAVVQTSENLTLWGDADKLSRVFNNILKNAASYSYPDSVIVIWAEEQGDNVIITFTNRGDPIPKQNLETIFEKFFRLDSSRSSHSGGAGLGLAIAKEIVTAHGGTIAAESNSEQTMFTVTLPKADRK